MPMQRLEDCKRCGPHLRVGFDADADCAARSRGMNVADAAVRELRAQLAPVHQSKIASAFAVDELLHQDSGASPAHLSIDGLELFCISRVARASRDLQSTIGLSLDGTARLKHDGKLRRPTRRVSLACAADDGCFRNRDSERGCQ